LLFTRQSKRVRGGSPVLALIQSSRHQQACPFP
jgi:hypothetical protein